MDRAVTAAPFRQRYCTAADGLTLAYRDYSGSDAVGVPVICLHGLTRTCRDFDELALWLSRRTRVLTLDFRGRGHSGRDPDYRSYHPLRYAEDTLAVMDAAHAARAAFVGTSLGGLVSMALAQLCPDRVAAVVLNDVGTRLSPAGVERITEYVGKSPPVNNWEQAAEQQKILYQQALPDFSEADWQAHARRCYRENSDGTPIADCDPNIARAIEVGSTASLDPVEAFSCLREVPTLLMRGQRSDILSVATAAAMRKTKPDLQYVEIPNRGHAPMLDEPAARAALDRFFAQLSEGSKNE